MAHALYVFAIVIALVAIGGLLPVEAATYVVRPDGTGDFPTIQDALDAIGDDSLIELTDGTFTGVGNRDLDYLGKAITIRSQSGDPRQCIIDCEQMGHGVAILYRETTGAVLEGVTITRGRTNLDGAAVFLYETPDGPGFTLRNCIFTNNHADFGGAVGILISGTVTITGCTFHSNTAAYGGGAIIAAADATLSLSHCTLVENSSAMGGGIICQGSAVSLENTIIAFNGSGEAIYSMGGNQYDLTCCNIYDNDGGDWTGEISALLGIDGNISADPIFCGLADRDLTLHSSSPCAPEHNPECGLIGALAIGCGFSAVEDWIGELMEPGTSSVLQSVQPNPFRQRTSIRYQVPAATGEIFVSLGIYDIGGRLVRMLLDQWQSAGSYTALWDGMDQQGAYAAGGLYFCRLRMGENIEMRRVVRSP